MGVISVIGPKGGIGKTTISINTASALTSILEPKSPKNRVCLIDLDLRLPTIASLLDCYPPKTFYDLFETETVPNFVKTNIMENFHKKIEDFDPNFIAISVVENTYPIARRIIRSLPEKMKKIPIVWGGVFASFASQIILNDNVGDYVCRGEGEDAMIEFCNRLCEGKPTHNVQNFFVKKNGNIFKNKMGPLANLESAPFPDYSLFADHAIYRPMQGKPRRTIGLETQRGCTFTCTYCNSPSQVTMHRDEIGQMFARKKSIKKVRDELDFLHKKFICLKEK